MRKFRRIFVLLSFALTSLSGCLQEGGGQTSSVKSSSTTPTSNKTSTSEKVSAETSLITSGLVTDPDLKSTDTTDIFKDLRYDSQRTLSGEVTVKSFSPIQRYDIYDQTRPFLNTGLLPGNNPNRSNICSPTSGSMALNAIANYLAGKNILPREGSETAKFMDKNNQVVFGTNIDQVKIMVRLMGTDPNVGTYFEDEGPDMRKGYAGRAGDFAPLSSGSLVLTSASSLDPIPIGELDLAILLNHPDRTTGSVLLLNLGFYQAIQTRLASGQSVVSYRFLGGHTISAFAYSLNSSSGLSFTLGDPAGGQRILPLKTILPQNGVTDPFVGTGVLDGYQSGLISVVESYTRINYPR